jgi:hypothetical protein
MVSAAHRDSHRGLTCTLALLLACSRAEPEPARTDAAADSPSPSLQVAVRGCDLLIEPDARRCLLGAARELSLWIPGPPGELDELALALDGVPLTAAPLVEPDGVLLSFALPTDHGVLALERGARTVWSLELAPHSSDYLALEKEVLALVVDGELERALARLDAGATGFSAGEWSHTRCLAAQLSYGTERLWAIIEQLRASPARGCLGTAELIAAHIHIYDQPDLNAAQRSIDVAKAVGADELGIHVHALFHQADLDLLVGRVDESIELFDRVLRLAAKLDEPDLVRSAQAMKTIALARLGRFSEADALMAALEAELTDADALDPIVLDIRYNLAWTALLRREDDRRAPDPTPTLQRLLETYRARGDARTVARTQLHLALAAEQSAELDAAARALADVDRSMLAPFELVWLELVGARISIGRGQLEQADAQLARAGTFAELSEDLEATWLLTTAQARLARAKGDRQAALAIHERAAVLADQLALSVPGTAGRSMLVTTHGRADAEHVELLLERSSGPARDADLQRAACVAAGSRARHLRSLWARLRPPLSAADQLDYQALLSRYEDRRKTIDAALADAWSLSADELARLRERLRGEGEQADALLVRATAVLERQAPAWSCANVLPRQPGRAVLTMIGDADRRRWWFMLLRADRPTRVLELPADADADALARAALSALADELADIEVLTVIPVGSLVGVDMQRLALAQPGLAGLELRYSLGLGRADEPSDPPPRDAAVIAGADDLAAVTEEAARVSAALRARGWTVSTSWSLTGEQPTLLHYSGHGHHSGLAGWSSSIEVPELGRVSAAQIVAGQRAPAHVVLGACSAGSTNTEIIDGGMNLAAAFLLAGAELVIAPSGPVDDAAALALAGELYRELDTPDADSSPRHRSAQSPGPSRDALSHRHRSAQSPGPSRDALAHALVECQRAELRSGVIEPETRSVFRWRVWVP